MRSKADMSHQLRIKTTAPKQIIDLTDTIQGLIQQANLNQGLCALFVSHTTAAITTGEIGEGTEQDFLQIIEEIIPRIQFRHAHDPSHAWSHMASSLLGPIPHTSCVGRPTRGRNLAVRDAGGVRRPAGARGLCHDALLLNDERE